MNYADDIAIIGNADARLAELLHQTMELPAADGERLLFEALWDPYPPLRHRAADELAAVMSDDLAYAVAQVAVGISPDGFTVGPMTVEVRRSAALALRTDALPARAHELLVQGMKAIAEGDRDE